MSNIVIDFRTLPANVPSLCIPRVFPNINEHRIRGIFSSLDMGEIEKIDIVPKKTEKGEKYNRVFIHFKRWNTGGNADLARERLINGKEIKIVYDEPWFWKISAYREPVTRPRPTPVQKQASKPRLQFDDDDNVPQPKKPERSYKKENRHEVRKPLQKAVALVPKAVALVPTAVELVPTTPPSTPPPTTPDYENEYHEEVKTPEPIKIDYGNVPPAPKKLNFKTKKGVVKVTEEGEL